MITKNEFYGQYFLSLRKDDEDFTPWEMVEIDRAWEVVAELQGEPDRIEGFISDDQVRSALEFPVDDDAEEPKPGKLKFRSVNIDDYSEYDLSDKSSFSSFFTDEQKAEIKAIANNNKEVK